MTARRISIKYRNMKKTNIFIADDHPVIRDGIRSVFSGTNEFKVVGEAGSGIEALEGISTLKPDLVLMDITMPELDGIAVTKRVVDGFPEIKVIMLSMHADPFRAIEAFRAGASGYVLKDSAPEEILKAAHKVLKGLKYASPAVSEGLLNDFVEKIKKEEGPADTLTEREKEIIRLIAGGATSNEIGRKLFISTSTVKSHRNKIMKKLGINDMASLIKIAIQKGIVSPGS